MGTREGSDVPPPPWPGSLETGRELETTDSTSDRILADPRRPPPHVPSNGMTVAVGVARSVVAAVVYSPGEGTVVEGNLVERIVVGIAAEAA